MEATLNEKLLAINEFKHCYR